MEGAKHLFTILTDHRNLEYLQSAKRLNHRQAGWVLFFTRFNFSVTYHPGSQKTKADALSHLHESCASPSTNELILSFSIIVAAVQWDITTEIFKAHLTDPPPAECPPYRTYVSRTLRQRLLQLVHSTPSSVTLALLQPLNSLPTTTGGPHFRPTSSPLLEIVPFATPPNLLTNSLPAFFNRCPQLDVPGLIFPLTLSHICHLSQGIPQSSQSSTASQRPVASFPYLSYFLHSKRLRHCATRYSSPRISSLTAVPNFPPESGPHSVNYQVLISALPLDIIRKPMAKRKD